MLTARPAGDRDLVAVEAITDAAYRDYVLSLGAKPLPMTQDYGARIGAGEVWMVMRDDAAVGVVVLETAPDHLLIFSLAVLPEAQGGGIGRWMLGFVEERARAAGVPEVRLYTNPLMARNIVVYGKAGYVETGRTPNPYRPGWVMVNMAKRV